MAKFNLTVSTPDGNAFSGDITCLILRGTCGDLAILAGHAPFATSVKAGKVRIEIDEDNALVGIVDGGLLTVAKDKAVLLSSSFVLEEKQEKQ